MYTIKNIHNCSKLMNNFKSITNNLFVHEKNIETRKISNLSKIINNNLLNTSNHLFTISKSNIYCTNNDNQFRNTQKNISELKTYSKINNKSLNIGKSILINMGKFIKILFIIIGLILSIIIVGLIALNLCFTTYDIWQDILWKLK